MSYFDIKILHLTKRHGSNTTDKYRPVQKLATWAFALPHPCLRVKVFSLVFSVPAPPLYSAEIN